MFYSPRSLESLMAELGRKIGGFLPRASHTHVWIGFGICGSSQTLISATKAAIAVRPLALERRGSRPCSFREKRSGKSEESFSGNGVECSLGIHNIRVIVPISESNTHVVKKNIGHT